jgi:putative hemolysin
LTENLSNSISLLGAELIGIAICIFLGALISAVDYALTALGDLRARAAREQNDSNADTAARLIDNWDTITARLLVGRVLCIVAAAALAGRLAIKLNQLWIAAGATVIVALFYLVAVSVTSTIVARRAGRLALPLLRFIRPLELLMAPIAAPLTAMNALINRLFPPAPEDDPERVTDIDVGQLIDQVREDGALTEEHAEMLHSVLEFRDTVAREVMVPRTRMVAIEIETPLSDVVRRIVETGHSRYPVYKDRVDQIEGLLYAKDLFRVLGEQACMQGKLADLIRRPVFFAAETQKLSDLLREMKSRRVHLAVVIDEFGGISGMMTLEDIIEEIVGEIRDEHDYQEMPVRKVDVDHYFANADVSVYDLAEVTGLTLPENAGSYKSLGGMIVDLMGHMPVKGESIQLGNYCLIVRGSDERHVSRVEIVKDRGAMLVPDVKK